MGEETACKTSDEDIWSLVEVSVFKPTEYSYRYAVHTEDRGLAVRLCMDKFPDQEALSYLNFITVKYGEKPSDEGLRL